MKGAKDNYIWNHKWKFWAKDGGPIGYKWIPGKPAILDDGWHYCWIEPYATKDGESMLMGF